MKIEIDDNLIKKIQKTFEGDDALPYSEKEWGEWIESVLEEHLDSWMELED
jgi:hypothetical protein